MSKLYMRTDGNGGLVISKNLLAVLSFLILALGMVVSAVFFSAQARADIDHISEKVDSIMSRQEQITHIQESVSVIKNDLSHVRETQSIIQNDLRDIRVRIGGLP